MKAKLSTETPTPVLPAEELDHARLSLSGLPKDVPLVIAVTYEDRFDTVTYELDATPDGTLEFTFPKLGAAGMVRVARRTADGNEQIGKAIPLDAE